MKNILLVFGGDSVESDISILTAIQMYKYVDKKQYSVIPCYIKNGQLYTFLKVDWQDTATYTKAKLRKFTPIYLSSHGIMLRRFGHINNKILIDCALLCNHGGSGENGDLQGALKLFDIPFSSCDVFSSALCMDKWQSYLYYKDCNLPCVQSVLIDRYSEFDSQEIFDEFGDSLIIKPSCLGSSIGVNIAKSCSELERYIELALRYDHSVIVQPTVPNLVEYNCAAIRTREGIVISEIERPLTTSEILSFSEKYISNGKMSGLTREFPAKIDDELKDDIICLTTNLYQDLNMYGIVRVDYLYDSVEKKLYVNEANTIPGSLAHYLFVNSGYSIQELLSESIEVGIIRYNEDKSLIKSFESGVLISSKSRKGAKCGSKVSN